MLAPQSGSPMTYMPNGKQYIVLAISGGTYSGDLLAFRLREEEAQYAQFHIDGVGHAGVQPGWSWCGASCPRAMKPGHERVPPYREPSPYMSTAEIQTELSKLDPKLVASRTGGAIDFAKGKAVGVVRRRMTGPQYAITHPRTVEYMMVIRAQPPWSRAAR